MKLTARPIYFYCSAIILFQAMSLFLIIMFEGHFTNSNLCGEKPETMVFVSTGPYLVKADCMYPPRKPAVAAKTLLYWDTIIRLPVNISSDSRLNGIMFVLIGCSQLLASRLAPLAQITL